MDDYIIKKCEEWIESQHGKDALIKSGWDGEYLNPYYQVCVTSFAHYVFEAGYKLGKSQHADK